MQNGKNTQFQGRLIISKKSTPLNDENDNYKKGKRKQKNKSNPQQPPVEQRVQHSGSSVSPQTLIFNDLCSRLTEYRPTTIKQVLQKFNYDKEQAWNHLLLEVSPDNEQQYFEEPKPKIQKKFEDLSAKKQSSDNSTSSQKANNLMNEVFDTLMKEEMNGQEFEQLFEQIAEMIKSDQKEHGKGVYEINSLVDQCNQVKNMILVGFRQELSNFGEGIIELDQSNPLYAETQQFMQSLIQKQIKHEKRRQDEFPSLGGSNNNQKTIIHRIQQSYKEQKDKKYEECYFVGTQNTLPQFAKQKYSQHTIFNVNNKLTSEKDLMSLNKEFGDVPIQHLKFVYKTFDGDYNICREFLNKYYGSKKSVKVFEVSQRPVQQQKKKIHTNLMKRQQVDSSLKGLTLEEIRQEIDHLYKLKHAFQFAKLKIKSNNQRGELDRIFSQKLPLIKSLSQASRLKLVQQMAWKNPLYADLHGYREEEVDPLLDSISEMIKEQYQRGNEKVRVRKRGGRNEACLMIMTGKGLHSRGNKSVLKPVIIQWCQNNDYGYEVQSDHIKLYLQI